jgi:hypothetical protein
MSAGHPNLQPLAQQILAVVDPLVEAASAAFAASPVTGPGKCQQVWCLACATAAIASGEQHPLKTIVAEHGTALLMVLRAVANPDDVNQPPPPEARVDDGDETSPKPGRYQPIPVTIDETSSTSGND